MTDKTKRSLPPHDDAERQDAIRAVRACNAAYTAAGRRRGVYVLTFGCQQNEADSEKLSGMAREMGYTPVDRPDDADLILVNTCAIREHAESRALATIGQYKKLRQENPELVIGVCGCLPSQEHRREELKRSYPYVTFCLDTASLYRLPTVLRYCLESHRRSLLPEDEASAGIDAGQEIPVLRTSSYRAWVSVMYGCNNFCSYCIVPHVRGRERSRPREAIVREVRELVAAGYRDITLLGQNVNSYGRGLAEPCDFATLVEELDAIPGDWWLRFMTSHPKDAGRRLIDVMAAGRHIAPAFHLPLQSGNDRVLHAMSRHYDMARYMDTVRYMREKIPDLTLTSDIIVGFPGETEAEFEDTLRALSDIRFDMIYSFIYSPRKGTPAAEMEQVPEEVQKNRFARMLELQNGVSMEKNQPLVGKTLRVLCDGVSKSNADLWTGRTAGNKSVFFPGSPDTTPVGQFIPVRIERAAPFALYGKAENPADIL